MLKKIIILSTLFVSSIAYSQLYNNGTQLYLQPSLQLFLKGDLNNFSGTNQGFINNSGTISINGNWINNASNTCLNPDSGSVSFLGNSSQYIQGSAGTLFHNLSISGTNGVDLNVVTTATVTNNLLFVTKRLINTSSSALLIIANNATVSGSSDSSFVNGPLEKIGNTAFTFPIGKGNDYQPLSISAPANITDAFTAQYFNTGQTLGNTTDTTISNLSTCEYWTLNRTAGSDNVFVTLGWNNSSCNIAANDSDMRVAYFDTTAHSWTSLGGSNFTGNTSQGTVTTNGPAIHYSTLILANKNIQSTNYTWNGSISSNWGTPANWTPNGIPTINDNVTIVTAANKAVYDGVSGGIKNLIIKSGTLDLSTNTFTISNNISFGGGTITNGFLNIADTAFVVASTVVSTSTTLKGNLKLTKGFVTTNNNIFTLTNTATVTGGNSSSFINGAVLKIGDSPFTFPIGSGKDYKPLTISAPVNATDSFAALYFNVGQKFGSAKDSSIANISKCEYWQLSKSINSSNVSVSVGWDTLSCNVVNNINNMRLAEWDSSKWIDLGGTNISGTVSHGTISSSSPLTIYAALTLANTNPCHMNLSTSSDTSICIGGSTTLAASGGVGYNWSPALGLNSTTIPNPVASPTITTTYTVTVTFSGGCMQTQAVKINVNPLPNVNSNATANSVCLGSGVVLNGTGAKSYRWTNNIISAMPFKPSATATYTVTGIDNKGCVDTSSITIIVNPNPIVSASATTHSICSTGTVTLSGSGAQIYTWSGGISNNIPFNPVATNTYTVVGTDANGCRGTSTTTVAVNSQPIIIANASSNNICPEKSIVLTGSGGVNYTWSNGVVNGLAFKPVLTNTYTVTGTDANGCSSTSTTTVNLNPAPNVIANTSSNSIACGTSITLTGAGAQSYMWSGGVTNGILFTPSSTQTYTVTGTDSQGCTATSTAVVTVNSAANVQAGTATTICAGGSTNLSASGGTIYSWSPANSLNDNALSNPVASPLSTTTYTVTVSNGFCISTSTVTITVNASPQAGITVSPQHTIANGNPNTIYVGSGAQSLTLTGNPGANAVSYGWSPSTTLSCTNCLTTQASPTTTITYTFTVTYSNGCTSVSTVTITVTNLLNVCKKC